MTVFWTRARHPELPDVVLPAAAMESYPEWEAVGLPSEDVDVLRAALAREQAVAAAEAEAVFATGGFVPAPPAPKPSAPNTGADTPESSAPAGADPKEQ